MSHEPHPNPVVNALVAQGLLDQTQVLAADIRAQRTGQSILKLLVADKIVEEAAIYRIVANATGLPYVELANVTPDINAVSLLPADWARRLGVLPFALDGDSLVVAISDPANITTVDDIRRLTRKSVITVLSGPDALNTKIDQVYRSEDELDDLADEFTDDMLTGEDDGEAADDAPVVRFVNLLLSQAITDRASDIHIEPTETNTWVRFRIDGVLHDQMQSPLSLMPPVASHIKIRSDMNIAERRIPQDGRLSIRVAGRKVDLRVATLPTVYGEKVVLRILDNSSAPTTLDQVGLSKYHQDLYASQYKRPYGMILVCGPTGSGKSTTLYTTLNTVKTPELNIITVEDPVEYRMPGVSQMQINAKAGLTFATALRSMLRADPDVILVGEIRDRETAGISVEAALTGHLVLSTLHTNDATSAVTRLVEMGIEPFLVGSALNVVVAQRLLRLLCPRCKEDYQPDAHDLQSVGFPWEPGTELPIMKKPVGCGYCSGTGYRGRTSIHEMLVVDPAIERMASDGAHTDQIRAYAVEHGMKTMREDGWEKVLAGDTTIEEVIRVSA